MLAYVHIPYCDSKCHYCAFNSYVGRFDTRRTYMETLYKQTLFEIERFGAVHNSIETLFVGGGTPSTIAPELYAPLFELLEPYLQGDAEITIEANPNSASREWLEGMRELGASRISFGVQSFDQNKLDLLGRAHSPSHAITSVETAAKTGFEHISIDLIYNVRGDNRKLLGSDIDKAFELPIDHISAYELTIEPNTPFAYTPQVSSPDESLGFFVADQITGKGFDHYEISNFGSYQSRHNLGYWQQKNYLGLGAGAVGFLNNKRFYPQTDIDAYIKNPLQISEENLSKENLLTEKLFLGFRSNIGVERSQLPIQMQKQADILVDERKLHRKGRRYYNNNFFISDELVLFVIGQ